MNAKTLAGLLFMLGAATARADCEPLLSVLVAKQPAPAASLSDCEADLLPSAPLPVLLRLQLHKDAAARWRDVLRTGGLPWRQLLLSKVQLDAQQPGMPGARLMLSHAPRLLAKPSWSWEARSARLVYDPGTDGALPVCRVPPEARLALLPEQAERPPGSLLALGVGITTGKGREATTVALDPLCVEKWALGQGAPARIDPRFGLTQIAADATAGGTFEVSAQFGQTTLRSQVRVGPAPKR